MAPPALEGGPPAKPFLRATHSLPAPSSVHALTPYLWYSRVLLAHNVDLNQVDSDTSRMTALGHAMRGRGSSVLHLLLAAGADPSIPDR